MLYYVLSVAAGMEKPTFVPFGAHRAAGMLTILIGGAIVLGWVGWLLWTVALAFKEYPGWSAAAVAVWSAIYYCYKTSDLTQDRFGLIVFVVVGGLGFVYLTAGLIREVERRAKREGADEERRRSEIASAETPGEIRVGYRPEDSP